MGTLVMRRERVGLIHLELFSEKYCFFAPSVYLFTSDVVLCDGTGGMLLGGCFQHKTG